MVVAWLRLGGPGASASGCPRRGYKSRMQAVQIEAFLAQTGLALEPEPRRPPPFGLLM